MVPALEEILAGTKNMVFFGGAGVSTESGIPDFRSTDGLYRQEYKYPPETILSHTFFEQNPEEFFRFYRAKLIPDKSVQPNAAHRRLAELEREGKLRAVITQNIDGLHQAACPEEAVNTGVGVPRCSCGGVLRPEVVLYEEPLAERDITDAVNFIRKADVLIVGGTSLAVYPAAGLLRYYEGRKLALVNMGATSYDESADLLIREKIGKVFSEV